MIRGILLQSLSHCHPGTTDFFGYAAARQFPDKALSVSPAQQQPQQQPPSDSIPVPAPGPTVPDQLIEVMQNMHHEQVRFLQPLGRNPCDHFRERNDERILNNLGPDVVICHSVAGNAETTRS